MVRQRLADPSAALVPVAGGHGAFGRGLDVVKARNAGEATWAKKQGKSFKDQRVREQFRTKVGFRNNSQKRTCLLHIKNVELTGQTSGILSVSSHG